MISTLLCCRNLAFFAGALFAVLTIFTLLDRDVLLAEHVLTAIAVLGETFLVKHSEIRSRSSYSYVRVQTNQVTRRFPPFPHPTLPPTFPHPTLQPTCQVPHKHFTVEITKEALSLINFFIHLVFQG